MNKTVRFWLSYAPSDPVGLLAFSARRARETFSTPPRGRASISFGPVDYQIDMSFHTMMRKYYFKTHEMFLERVFRRHLKPGSVFIDVGANCGYWSALSAFLVGPSGAVHAFEPVQEYAAFVQRLAELNPDYAIVANNQACGAERGTAEIAFVPPRSDNFDNFDINIGSSSLLPGFLTGYEAITARRAVEVVRLDDYIDEHNVALDSIGLIKVDVEGFESAVLDGMPRLLAKPGRKVPLLIEVLTDTTRSASLDGPAVVRRLAAAGYKALNALTLAPFDEAAIGFEENVLFVTA